jgi:ABC-type histidine transport system ATPase subunit
MSALDILITYREAFSQGLLTTFELAAIVWMGGLIFGSLLGVLGARYRMPIGIPSRFISFTLSGMPILVFLFWLHYPLQSLLGIVVDQLPYFLRTGKKSSARFDELVSLFDMEKFVDRYPNETSLGQRQRAALVRALMLEPKYMLLDEITSSLDVEQVALILHYLRQLADSGIGILIITHLLRFARDAASNVVFLDSGKVLESGGCVLESPTHPRVRRFVSMIESAS